MQQIEHALERLRAVAAHFPLYDWDDVPTFAPGLNASQISALAQPLSGLPSDVVMFLGECSAIVGAGVHNGYFIGGAECFRVDMTPMPAGLELAGSTVPITAVGSDGGGNRFVLALGAANPVAKWDHETNTLSIVADSFADFLTRVAVDWERYLAEDGAHKYLSG